MNQVPDRKKLRREYLMKKAKAIAGAIISIPVLTVIFLSMFLFLLSGWYLPFLYVSDMEQPFVSYLLSLMFMMLCLCAFFGIPAVWVCRLIVRQAGQALAQLPYVPPATADTIPSEEVLLRGAQEPAATHDTLLRATTTAQEAQAEELLRVQQP